MTYAPRTPASQADFESSGGRLVTADGRALPLIGASLKTDAKGGLARIVLEQTFRNPHDEPLRVTYSLPLPADGAVSGFAFRIGDERIVGHVEPKKRAREIFENAVLHGHTAALLDQERSSLFTQEVGNVPPRTQVVCEVQVDQRLTWLSDGAWEWRFPTVVAPRYLGAQGRVADAAKVTVDVADSELPVKLSLSMSIRDGLVDGARPESPSHSLHSESLLGRFQVSFGDERGVQLDRDVVVRWRVAAPSVGTSIDVSNTGHALLTLVPPAANAKKNAVPRDLIVLLDTSGSMGGAPLDQARRVTAALVDSLGDADQLELIEFSNTARRWKRGAVNATAANRRDAQSWLARLTASGGTEMRTGILEALNPLRAESQRQVVLITDGQIGFEHEILSTIIERLPRGCRVHTVGVGSGVNRSLLKPAAQAGRGVELIIGIGEDVEPLVKRLLSRTHEPLLTNVEISGSAVLNVAPTRIADLFGGAPSLISLALKPEGGEVIVRARSAEGDIEERVQVKGFGEASSAVRALFAREQAEELELMRSCSGDTAGIDSQLERLGTEFQISTRMTSWVAVSTAATVDPRAPKREETMPHELAYGLSAEGVGLRGARVSTATGAGTMSLNRMMAQIQGAPAPAAAMAPPRGKMIALDEKSAKRERSTGSFAPVPPPPAAEESADDSFEGEQLRSESAPETPAPVRRSAPAPMKDEPEKKKGDGGGGFFGAVKRKLSELGGAGRSAVRRMKASARRVGNKLIITIVAPENFSWVPPGEATVNFDDGSAIAKTDDTLTTRASVISAGLTITFALELSDDGRTPRSVEYVNGFETIELELQ